ncbi:MAG: hemolysin family protein [Bacteroidetes bacterium]|nr:hemolysin family protein [Bacteroidota bacterium]
MSTSLEVALLLLLILANGLFAMSEMALVSSRKARLQQRAADGKAGAQQALNLIEDPTRFLSTVQVGITLIAILTGLFGGQTLGAKATDALLEWGVDPAYAGPLGTGLTVLMVTYLSLVFGELLPKRIALSNPERIAMAMAGPMTVLSRIASPFVVLLEKSTNLFSRLLGNRASEEPVVTDEEITHLLQQGADAGVFDDAEREIVENVLWLGDQRVRGLMTPRRDVVWLDLEDPPEINREKIISSNFSRFPVARGDLDDFVGVVRAKDLLSQAYAGEAFDLEAVVRDPMVVPASLSALRLLETLRRNQRHIALVVDEHGSVQGLVTHNEVLDGIAELEDDPEDPDDPDIVRRDDGSYLLDGGLDTDELKDVLDLRELPDENDAQFHTLAGFILSFLGHVPHTGEAFDFGGYRFEVVDLDHHRVDRVLVSRLPEEDET